MAKICYMIFATTKTSFALLHNLPLITKWLLTKVFCFFLFNIIKCDMHIIEYTRALQPYNGKRNVLAKKKNYASNSYGNVWLHETFVSLLVIISP